MHTRKLKLGKLKLGKLKLGKHLFGLWAVGLLLLLLGTAGGAGAQAVYVPSPSIAGTPNLSRLLSASRVFSKPPSLLSYAMNAGAGSASDTSGTSMLPFVMAYACHDPEVVWSNYVDPNSAGENVNAATFDMTASIEYPAGTIYPLTFGGNVKVRVSPYAIIKSDPIALSIPAGAIPTVRTYHSLVSGSIPVGPVAGFFTNPITTTGTYVGGNNYLVSGSRIVTAATNATPIVASVNPTTNNIQVGDSVTITGATGNTGANGTFTVGAVSGANITLTGSVGNGVYGANSGRLADNNAATGNGSDQTQAAATSWVSNSNIFVFGPVAFLAAPDTNLAVPVVGITGDSIGTGQNSYSQEGYVAEALWSGNVPYYQMSRSGENFTSVIGAAGRNRLAQIASCSDDICEYGVNDIFGNFASLSTVQASAIATWREIAKRGPRVWQMTLTPETTSTDGYVTAGNQTPKTNFAVRYSFNDWLRDGAPLTSVSSLTPVAVGTVTAGTIRAGQPGHPLAGVFDAAAKVEVNASNVLTVNGGRWYCGAGNNTAYSEGTHPNTLATALLRTAIDTTKFTAN